MTKAVILAAGKGTRCTPLTLTRPKVLLKVANKTLLVHNLEQLTGIVTEVIIVIGYLGEKIKGFIGEKYGKLKITYREQKEVNGTGGALNCCKDLLKEKFIVLNGDDLYSKQDIKRCLKHDYAVLAQKVANPERMAVLEVKNNFVTNITEKPEKPSSNLANTGCYLFSPEIFTHLLKKSPRGEYEITDYITFLINSKKKVVCEIVQDYWMPVGYSWDILKANEFLLERIKPEIKKDATIENGATIKGKVTIGKNTVIKSGAYIEGPVMIGDNCTIGPNCFIRASTTIGNNCRINNASEIKTSVFFDHSYASHLSYVCDSVVGENVNIGAGTIIANLRHDVTNVKTKVNGELVDTGRRKFGTIMGDGAKTGIHTSIYPGRKIWPGKTTLPGEVVKDDIN